MPETKLAIAIHGGAGTIKRSNITFEKEALYKNEMDKALNIGYNLLEEGASALDAVEAAVITLENSEYFNAGKGSVFSHNGLHEMDASIMCGRTINAGAIASVQLVKNPILLARLVMEKSDFVFLGGKGAEEFARNQGLPFESPSYFFTQERLDQLQKAQEQSKIHMDHQPTVEDEENKFGTVGAVALDSKGNIAAATSTGGMTNKKFGRIGDSAMIGSGTYANNLTCAVSCTGHGEYFIRAVAAYDVSCLMEYKAISLEEACDLVVNNKLKRMGGEGGLIALNTNGDICISFNSEGMYRAYKKTGEAPAISVFKD